MKKLTITFGLIILSLISFSQNFEKTKDGRGFNSVFKQLASGQFSGSVNGILILKNYENKKAILDFQGSDAELNIEKDSNEIYDISTKIYKGVTTSGKTKIEYKTYGMANELAINIYNYWFSFSTIDGGCDLVINGLDYYYELEESTEYLILKVTHEIELTNWQDIKKNEFTRNPNNIDELKQKEKTIKILPNSVLVFAINRN